MESKDLPSDDSHSFRTRPQRASLQLDASKFSLPADMDEAHLESSTPSTSASSTAFPGRPRALTQGSPALPGPSTALVRNRSATIANPPKSAPPASAPPEKEKRKRSRVTPDQLTHLERIFALDRSPTAAKRKEISEMLGMQERQTQIWFQNRRAKAKTLEGKGKVGFRGSPTSGGDSPPDTPPDFNSALDVDLQTLIHEDEPVTFIPCNDLSIGSWRRISATLGQHDLVAYISNAKRCLTWFIYSNGYGFKMEIPFDSITSTTFTSASPGQGLASFFLSRPPLFYLESLSSPDSGGATSSSTKIWKKCADWTEGQQASKILRHDLVGAAQPLINALKSLPGSEHHATDPMAPMHIPPPPMAGLDAHPFAAPSHLTHRKQSPDMVEFSLLGGSPGTVATDAHAPAPFSTRPSPISFQTDYPALFRAYPTAIASHQTHSSLTDFSSIPISHTAPRPYSADTQFSFEPERYPPAEGGRNQFGTAASAVQFGTASPAAQFGTASPTTQFGAASPTAQFGTASPTAQFGTTSPTAQFATTSPPTTQFGTSSLGRSSPTLLTSAFDPATLHHDVQMSAGHDASKYSGGTSDSTGHDSAAHDTPFEATLGMQHDPL